MPQTCRRKVHASRAAPRSLSSRKRKSSRVCSSPLRSPTTSDSGAGMSSIRGVNGVVRVLDDIARAAGPEAGRQMRIDAEQIMTDVKQSRPGHGVPRDTGVLAGSGRVDGPSSGGIVSLTFGGAAAAYALRQHEDLTLRHNIGEA